MQGLTLTLSPLQRKYTFNARLDVNTCNARLDVNTCNARLDVNTCNARLNTKS